ncbi:alpha/beta fold hydrolase [Streptomyces sp. NPDC041068]|uniref:thioesterase II family protein n=1 Tax=Streptomyces sp. NPDC041068 TaxID=3155130 RepID=UPI0033EB507D
MKTRERPPRWLGRRRARPDARLQVYVFAHAGGSPGEYLPWSDELTDLQIWGVQLPGRGARLADPVYTELAPLVDDLVSQVSFTGPFVLFGHSFGALLAYETARALRRAGRDLPEHLILSSGPVPNTTGARDRSTWLHTLADDDLITAAEKRWGPLPDQVRTDARLRQLILGPLRADLGVMETYVHVPGPRLDIPATLLRGTREGPRSGAEGVGWDEHLARITARHALPGGHFYFREDRAPVLDVIRAVTGPLVEVSA